MSTKNSHYQIVGWIACMIVVVAGLIAAGCSGKSASTRATTQPAVAVAAAKSGTQLWEENCMRCHNLRSPETFSDAQWELAVHHMRLRANLTGEEQRKITAFLKAAN